MLSAYVYGNNNSMPSNLIHIDISLLADEFCGIKSGWITNVICRHYCKVIPL